MQQVMVPRHRSFFVALAAGIVAGIASVVVAPALASGIGVNVFFVVYLALTAVALRKLSPSFLRQHAADDSAPAPFILFVMVAAVVVSAGSLFVVLVDNERAPVALLLGVVSVVLGWFAVNTMWAMHYAFEYYQAPDAERGKPKSGKVEGGLDFPGGDDPDGTAFVYFSYVIGMTAQTADTNVTSNAMRRLVTVHSVFSFFFNTGIVAAAVNIAVTLGH